MADIRDRLSKALRGNWQRREQEQWIYGKLGRYNGTSVIYEVKGRKNFLYVTIRNASGSQTTVPARNDAGVPQQENLPVKIKLEYGVYVIYGRTGKPDEGISPVVPPSGISLHADSHKHLGDDEIATEIPAAFQIPKAEANGNLNNSWLNTGHGNGIDADTVDGDHGSNLKDRANHSGTQLASTISDFASAVTALVSSIISAFSAKTTPIDADSWLITDSADSDAPKRVTGTNVKAWLKAYFDTLYGLLATANTWTKNNAFNSTDTSGSAFSVTRNLTATSTDSPVVTIHQDHASDDQDAVRITQDGTGDILELLDGATVVLRVLDGGRLEIAQIIRALTSSGLRLEDDGGNLGIFIEDGGFVGINTTNPQTVFHVHNATDKNVLFDNAWGGENRFFSVNDAGTTLQPFVIHAAPMAVGLRAGAVAASVGGVIYISTTAVGNVGGGEDTLNSYSVPASTLNVNTQSLWFEASGTTAANANTKTIRLSFGGVNVVSVASAFGSAAVDWTIRGRIIRTGATSQKVYGEIFSSASIGALNYATLSATLSSPVTIAVTGESSGSATNDVVNETFIVGFDDITM